MCLKMSRVELHVNGAADFIQRGQILESSVAASLS